jgi:hypothetical protein
MGIAELFSSVADIYSHVKSGVSEIYNFGKSIVHGTRQGFNWIDEQLDKAASIPFVGELLAEGIEELKDTQILGFSWNRLKKGIDHLDEWMQHSEIESISQTLDNAITSALEFGERYGGEVDMAFSGGSQPMGGIMT